MDRNPTSNRLLQALVVGGLVAMFGWFIWPTQYEYTREAPNVFRVNRFTGVTEISTPSGWQVGTEPPPPSEHDRTRDRILSETIGPEAQARELDEKRKLGRTLTDVSFGDENQYRASTRISYSNGGISYEVSLRPYSGALKSVFRQRDRSDRFVAIKLYNSAGFVVQELKLSPGSFSQVQGSAAARPDSVPTGTKPDADKVTVGKLGQTVKPVKITSKPGGGRTYYSCKAYEYLVLTATNDEYYRVLLQNGVSGYVLTTSVAALPYDVTRPKNAPAYGEPSVYLQAEGRLIATPTEYDDISRASVVWSWQD